MGSTATTGKKATKGVLCFAIRWFGVWWRAYVFRGWYGYCPTHQRKFRNSVLGSHNYRSFSKESKRGSSQLVWNVCWQKPWSMRESRVSMNARKIRSCYLSRYLPCTTDDAKLRCETISTKSILVKVCSAYFSAHTARFRAKVYKTNARSIRQRSQWKRKRMWWPIWTALLQASRKFRTGFRSKRSIWKRCRRRRGFSHPSKQRCWNYSTNARKQTKPLDQEKHSSVNVPSNTTHKTSARISRYESASQKLTKKLQVKIQVMILYKVFQRRHTLSNRSCILLNISTIEGSV